MMNEHNGISPWNGLLFNNQKGWSTGTQYNMNWPQKKPDMKSHILYGSIYMKYSNRPICRDGKQIILPETEGKES